MKINHQVEYAKTRNQHRLLTPVKCPCRTNGFTTVLRDSLDGPFPRPGQEEEEDDGELGVPVVG